MTHGELKIGALFIWTRYEFYSVHVFAILLHCRIDFDKATQTDRQIIIIIIIMETISIAPKNRMNGTYMTEQKVNKSV